MIIQSCLLALLCLCSPTFDFSKEAVETSKQLTAVERSEALSDYITIKFNELEEE